MPGACLPLCATVVRLPSMALSALIPSRALPNGLSHRSTMSLARYTSHRIHQPAFDRYTTIRTFFRRQQHNAKPQDELSSHFSEICDIEIRRFPGRVGAFSLVRHFHSCSKRLRVHERPKDNIDPKQHWEDSSNKENQKPFLGDPLDIDEKQHNLHLGASSQTPPPVQNYENYPKSLRRLAASLPHLHRPTRDDFLQVASGFWQRARIRFKWFTIKSFRKFNADDISAFVTWFLTAQFLWILIGT